MNLFTPKIIAFVVLLCLSSKLMAHVELDYPVGGETITAGTSVIIQWHIAIAHNTLNWDLYYSSDGGTTWEPIQLNIPPGQLTYAWNVPSQATSQARVRVFQNNSSTDYIDISDNFTIALASTLPVIEITAQDISIECSASNQQSMIQSWLNNHGGAIANNICTDVTWTNDFSSLDPACGASGSAQVTFTVTDMCGSTWTSAFLEIVDTTLPVLNSPAADMTVESDGNGNTVELNGWINSHGGAIASDACSSVIWIYEYTSQVFVCGVSGTFEVLFTAMDECGNSQSTAATFRIADTVSPVITVQAHDTIIQCGIANQGTILQSWINRLGGAQATDTGSNINWSHNPYSLTDSCGQTQQLNFVFTATDGCGNANSTDAVFTILGTTAVHVEFDSDAIFKLFPNPASDKISIRFEKDPEGSVQLSLFNTNGKTLWHHDHEGKNISLPVDQYVAGIYFLQVKTEAGTYLRKVIVK